MTAFNRIVLSGTLAGGEEQWSTSCAFVGPSSSVVSIPADLMNWAADIMSDLETLLPAELKIGLGANGALTEVRAYFYPSENSNAAAVGISNGTIAGTTGISRPTSVAAVLSLSTGLAGRRYRGRMYWPAMSNTINTSGRFTGTVTSNLANAGSDLLGIIAAVIPGGGIAVPVVVSKAGGFVTPVTQIRVGDVPDTMRSRRDAMDEAYAVASI